MGFASLTFLGGEGAGPGPLRAERCLPWRSQKLSPIRCEAAGCKPLANPSSRAGRFQAHKRPNLQEDISQMGSSHICAFNLHKAWTGASADCRLPGTGGSWPGKARALLWMKMLQLPGKPLHGITQMYSICLPSDTTLSPCL